MGMSQVPIKIETVPKQILNAEILRTGISAEIDAINLYEQMAAMTTDGDIKRLLLDIAKEEKTHIGEFETLLLNYDEEQVTELEAGREEVAQLGIEIYHPIVISPIRPRRY